jgi:IclR family pca regulon transcriptional regulator
VRDNRTKLIPHRSKTMHTDFDGEPMSTQPTDTSRPPSLSAPSLELDAFAGDPNFMTSLARGLLVITAFGQQQRAMTVAQLSIRTGLSRAAVRRCIYTLAGLGFASSEDGRHYALTPKVLSLGHAYLSSSPLATLAQPVLNRISERVQESSSAATLEGDEILYITRSKSDTHIMSVDLGVGSRLPAYCTSMGRVMLAALPPAQLDEWLAAARLVKRTAHTVSDAEGLRTVLAEVRANGYAIVDQELEVGLRSIAVPVFNREGRAVTALNISSHSSRMPIADMQSRLLPVLREAAQELQNLLA